ncbi:MAG: hypothetical protein ACTS9Y_01170 [Methylophilus sp.]|uniref:hypothetical protein n=1 Tax=Methylophilus sp. TaxID=29541 RepID=UPI003FA1215D
MSDMYPPEVLEIMVHMPKVKLKSFAFNATGGGTQIVNYEGYDFGLKFDGDSTVKVINGFFDPECGHRFHSQAVSEDLIKFLEANGGDKSTVIYFDEYSAIELAVGDLRLMRGAANLADEIREEIRRKKASLT